MKTLKQINDEINGATLIGSDNPTILGISHDSRQVKPGYIFAALKGETVDGTQFIKKAVENGAVAVLCDSKQNTSIGQLIVDDPKEMLGYVAAAVYDHPSAKLDVVGITGTNGKTTITYIVERIMREAKRQCGVMGTIEYRLNDHHWNSDYTTPEAPEVQDVMQKMVDKGADTLAMEVSSHGLALGRIHGVLFDVVAFTNLTQDHLDFHSDMEDYGNAKLKLFTQYIEHRKEAKVVVNIDDAFSKNVIAHTAHSVMKVSAGLGTNADICPIEKPSFTIEGISARIKTPNGEFDLQSGLCGLHYLNNLLVGLAIGIALGISEKVCLNALKGVSVPGRLERVPSENGVSIFVDYAHTPDALENVIDSVKPLTKGRLMCLFGCGGDRDAKKRPMMGAAVAKRADICVATSDNPRSENPEAIIEMIVPGMKEHVAQEITPEELGAVQKGYICITDRREAIKLAVNAATADDTILIAGKGHEDYIIIGKEKFHFDDREEARAALAAQKKVH